MHQELNLAHFNWRRELKNYVLRVHAEALTTPANGLAGVTGRTGQFTHKVTFILATALENAV
jgi:hypothetical protein